MPKETSVKTELEVVLLKSYGVIKGSAVNGHYQTLRTFLLKNLRKQWTVRQHNVPIDDLMQFIYLGASVDLILRNARVSARALRFWMCSPRTSPQLEHKTYLLMDNASGHKTKSLKNHLVIRN